MSKHRHILLCFSADWCPPCRAMEGTLINTAFELEHKALVIKADPKVCEALAASLNVRSVPAYVAFNDGVASEPVYGIQRIDSLLDMVLV
ncbi:thioredoxin family protein [Shewanella cyperi]|uniref:Thioredoxin family protein n=1 Tax=Shewanella cyperi TaxID=2814292 RepID=A0A974XPJ2_9GAMM|nr:thioredoxin family protein [Shewanella cyperi]QSX31043.1 thioredoxin family protein [Shewanella cyperi]